MVLEKVKNILAEQFDVEEDTITEETSLQDDLGADSLDAVELIMEFEKEFVMTIPDEVAERMRTVGDAIDYIERHK